MTPPRHPSIDVTARPSTSASTGGLDALAEWARRRSWWKVVGLVMAAATVVSRLPGALFNGMFDRDEAFLAVTGDVLRHGGTLYVDVIDRKPPVVPYAYALLRDLSVDVRTVRVAVALLVFVNGVVVVSLVRRLSGSRRAALFAGVMAVTGTAMFLPADAQAANFELWGLLPASAAILAVVIARTSTRSWLWFALAGAAALLAAQCKQPYVVVLVPVVFEVIRRGRGRVASAAAVGLGASLMLLPFALVGDARRMVRWVWTDNGDYLSGGVSIGRALLVGLGLGVVFCLFHTPMLYGLWAAARRRVHPDPVIVVWLAVSVLVLPLGLRFFGHYFQQVVPPLAVLTGLALPAARPRVWRALAVLTAALTVVMVVLSLVHRPDLTDFRAVGRYVQRTTAPTDRILVWGALPDVYVAAERDPAGVFLHGGYLTGNWASRSEPLPGPALAAPPFDARWDLFWADVATRPPAMVIDAARPGTDWAAYGPARFPIGAWLDRCYVPEGVIDGLRLWRRDPTRCPQ